MARIEIPNKLLDCLGPSMSMDIHWVDVKLKDGRIYRKLVVRGGKYITGRTSDPEGIGMLEFSSGDIYKVRRKSIMPFLG
jgi:hypothetical protein